MKKQKIYLDTSVISYLDQPEREEKWEESHTLWDIIKSDTYNVYISDVTIEEIQKCEETKRSVLFKYLAEINYTKLVITEETENLAEKIISNKILKRKSYDDCLHIASAVISECDMIISWNFKHLVNVETIDGIRAINIIEKYKTINIYSPSMLIYKEN
jgi:predicted nucleic acid-binding protein